MNKTLRTLKILAIRMVLLPVGALIDGYKAFEQSELTNEDHKDFERLLKIQQDLTNMTLKAEHEELKRE